MQTVKPILKMKTSILAILSCIAALWTFFYVPNLPAPRADGLSTDSTGNNRSITVDSVNMTVGMFFAEFTSPSEIARKTAMLYLLGVLDASEGQNWCDYHTIKTVSIREYIYEYLKNLPRQRYNERAATVIKEALNKSFPCRSKK